MRGQILRQLHRREDLFLLRPQIIGIKRNRLLHRCQRQQLQQMVLDHIPRRTHTVVIPRPATGPNILSHRDLDMIHIIGVPQRLEQLVRETQRQNVLHRLLPQIMINPEHRVRREHRLHNVIQRPRRFQIMPERLLNHHPTPLLPISLRQPMLGQLPANLLKRLRRNRQIKRVITPRPTNIIKFLDRLTQPLKRPVIIKRALNKPHTLSKLVPHRLIKRRPSISLHRSLHLSSEIPIRPRPPPKPHQRKTRRQQPTISQVIHRRHQLLTRKIPRHPKEHQRRRTRNPTQTTVTRIPQRITPKPSGTGQRSAGEQIRFRH